MLNVKLLIQSDGGESLELQRCVAKYELRDAISELFELTVEILITDHAFDASDVVGRRVLVSFGDEAALTEVQGIVGRLRQLTSEPTGVSRYQIVVVPFIWPLTRRVDHRIFRDLSVIEILETILTDHGLLDFAPRILCRPRAKREYCVQYAETDFDFVQRILADEGLSFYFDHQRFGPEGGDDKRPPSQMTVDELIGRDSAYAIPLQFAPVLELRPDKFVVLRVLMSAGIDTYAVQLRGYDFERLFDPRDLAAKADDPMFPREGTLQSYTYEPGVLTRADMASRPKQLLEEARSGRTTYEIETNLALAPATRFVLEGHPSVSGGMLIVRSTTVVRLEHDKPVTSYVLNCIPATEAYRPPRRPKPLIHGTHTALVVGKKVCEDEIEVDQYGRVRVWFHWDRRVAKFEGKLTRFIRVSQAWAGAGYGMVLLPRVGDEVIVSYTDGDPDEPIIVGRVHNVVSTTPLNLSNPDDYTVSIWKSRSSPQMADNVDRYNMVRMQDKAGEEMLELRAQRNFHHETLANASIQVGGSQSTSAGSISESSASTISVSAKESITQHAGVSISGSSDGNIGQTAAMNMGLKAGNRLEAQSVTVKVDARMLASVHAGSDLVLQSDVNASLGGSVVEIDGAASVSVRAPEVSAQASKTMHVSGGSVSVVGAGPVTIKGGGIVKIIGGVVEVNGGRIKLNC